MFSSTFLCLLSLFAGEFPTETVVLNKCIGGIVRKAIVVSPERFSVAAAETQARQFLQENTGPFKILMFYIFSSEGTAGRYFAGKGSTDQDYDDWLRLFNLYGRDRYPVAEMLALGDSATLRYRDGSGKLGQVVLRGDNTYTFSIAQNNFEIVAVTFATIPTILKGGPHEPVSTGFCIKTNAQVQTKTADTVLRFLNKKVKTRNIGVALRNDIWFIEDITAPIVSPFFDAGIPPSKDAYGRSKTVSCGLWSGKYSCFEYGDIERSSNSVPQPKR